MPRILPQKLGQWLGLTIRLCVDTGMTFSRMKGVSQPNCKGSTSNTVDEALNHKAAEWVREHAFVKGEPNMTFQSFCDWINNHLLPFSHLPPHFPCLVALQTAVRCLRFKPVSHKKGAYIDGHECEDVVKHRESLLKTLHDLCVSHRPPLLCSDEPPHIR